MGAAYGTFFDTESSTWIRDHLVVVAFRDPSPVTGLSGGLQNDSKLKEIHEQLASITGSWPRVSSQECEIYVSDPETDLVLPSRESCPSYDDLGTFVIRHERLLDSSPSFFEKWKLTSDDYAGLGKPDINENRMFGDWDEVLETLGLTDERLERDQREKEGPGVVDGEENVRDEDLASCVQAMTLD